jgi:hypothetical protein
MATQIDHETVEMWPEADEDRALNERLRAGGVRLATRSLDRPRVVVKPRPAWLARLLTLPRVRA